MRRMMRRKYIFNIFLKKLVGNWASSTVDIFQNALPCCFTTFLMFRTYFTSFCYRPGDLVPSKYHESDSLL